MAENNEKLCRICLRQTADSSFDVEFGDFYLAETMKAVFGIKLDLLMLRMKNVPKKVCNTCQEMMKIVLDFKKLAWQSHTRICDLKEGELLISSKNVLVEVNDERKEPNISMETIYFKAKLKSENVDAIKVEDATESQPEPSSMPSVSDYGDSIPLKTVPIGENQNALLSQTKKDAVEIKQAKMCVKKKGTPKTQKEIKMFSCDVCSKKFVGKHHLKRHLEFHFQIRQFECKQCQKSFVTKANLKEHIRIHTGNKPFSCPKCKKKFTQYSTLGQHLTTHSDVQAFSCGQCGTKFKTKRNARNHVIRFHGKDALENAIIKS